MGVEVVISGAAGAFPECKNIPQFEDALFKKAHLITEDDRKWAKKTDLPGHCGKALSHQEFDALFFKVPFSLPPTMEPITKKALETSIEAIIDAGVNPKSLAGTRTAVYCLYDFSEFEMSIPKAQTVRALVGIARCFSANRLSFAMDLQGPSYSAQGGYGSLFHFMGEAKQQIEAGLIDAAVIACGNFILSKRSLLVLRGMGLMADDGECRAFDENAHGYALSEGCVAFFLQRATDARRHWATVVGGSQKYLGTKKGNVLAFDEGPIKEMMRELYFKWNVDPADVGYIEADGCGIKDTDRKEADIIAEVFCRKRKEPLLVGSVKSNAGHAESVASAFGTVKAMIAFQNSKIPPNINITSPIPELTSRGIKVVTEETPFNGELIGINSIGQFGNFGHMLLKANAKKSSTMQIEESLPQMVLLSSRTESGIEEIKKQIRNTKITPEFAALVNGVFSQEVQNHMYRCYAIVPPDSAKITIKSERADGGQRPIWWVFSGMGSQWTAMGAHLMHIPIFHDVINRCDKVLAPLGVDIIRVLTSADESIFDNILNAFVGITACQIGLVEILRELKLEPEGMVGHSVGELGCAYADSCLTLEQAILAAHARGRASQESTLIKGMMAAVGMGHNDIVNQLPESIDVACRNSSSSCTLSGPAEDVKKFVSELSAKGVFAKGVNVANIAYHSRYIQPAGPILLKYLKEAIPENTKRSSKWISSSIPEKDWDSDLATYCSPEYLTNNLLSPVLFEDAIKSIPSDAVLIEIAPHGLLQAILKRAMTKKATNVPLTHRSSEDGVKFLLEAIGQLYLLGFEPDLSALYPPVQYPVPLDTPSLQPFVTWDHTEEHYLPKYMRCIDVDYLSISEKCFTLKEIMDVLKTYKRDDSPVSLLSFFLIEVWKIFGALDSRGFDKVPVVFENIQIYSKLDLSVDGRLSQIWIQVMRGTGEFVVLQEPPDELESEFGGPDPQASDRNPEIVIIRGKIKMYEPPLRGPKSPKTQSADGIGNTMDFKDISNRLFGDSEAMDGLATKDVTDLRMCSKGVVGKISLNPDWNVYLHTIFELNTMRDVHGFGQSVQPVGIQSMLLNPEQVENQKKALKVDFFIDRDIGRFQCVGVTIDGFKTKVIPSEAGKSGVIHAERLYFAPYTKGIFKNLHDFARASLQIIVENSDHFAINMGKSLKIKVFYKDDRISAQRLLDLYAKVLQDCNDLNVEFVPTQLSAKLDSKIAAGITYISDPKELAHLPNGEDFDNVYLFVAVPSKIQIKSIVDTASKFKQKYAVIYEQQFNSHNYGLLKKNKSGQKWRVCHVSKSVLSTLDDLNSDGRTPNEGFVLVVPKSQFVNPTVMMPKILKKARRIKLRCFFLLDDDASPFSLDNKFYREQLEKNVVVNVLKNGKWGSFRGTPLHRPAPTDVAQILPHVHQVSEEVNIRYIGLNPASTERRTKGTPAVLDYSGTTQSGGHVMGIAHKHEGFEGKILLDPVFQWTLPDSFTLTEAASLPSAYLMAHLIMKEIVMVPFGHTVFILNGQTPVSMALISLCLARNFEVFTTVPTEAARQLVSLLFPQIPESNITNHNSGDFYVPVMFKTKGVGARIVVSDLPYKQMLSAWKCSGRYGCFINLNDASMDHNAPLPMGMFSVSNGYYFYPLSKLARLPKQEKIQLHALVKESLSSMVHMPHQSMSIKDIGQLNSYVEKITEQGGKLLLDVGTNYKANTVSATTSNESLKEQIEWIADEHSQFSFVIISSSVGRSVNVVEWLLDRGVKNIVLSTLDADPSSDAVRKLNTSTSKHEATLLMTSAKVAHTAAGVEGVLNQARRLGKISTIFTISLVNNDSILPHIQKVMNVASEVYSIINIHRDPNVCEVENTVTILCDDEMDCSHVLSQAMTEPNKPATYVVSDAKGPGGSDADVEESIEDFLPSSLQQLEDMGRLLCLKDAKLSPHTSAIFMQTTSLAADMSDIQHGDALPVFFIPAFCETQLRPLLTRLMYPCFVAHVYPDGMSAEQVAAQLFESMIRIQSKGPYTIVSETWSGGVGMLLANLLTDSKQEVSLFLLHGIPTKMCSLLPLEDSLNEYVIKILHRLIEKEQPGQLKGLNGTKRLEAAVKLLPSEFDKAFVSRSLQTIQRSLHLTRSLLNRQIYLRSSLVAMEISQFCKLTIDELGEVSKSVQLVKIDCENYKEMLSHSRTTKLIAEEALFSW